MNDDVNIVYPLPGGRSIIELTDQTSRVQAVTRKAITLCHEHIIIKHAFPELGKKITFTRDTLAKAAQDLKYLDIKARMEQDEKYAKDLGSLVSPPCLHSCLC